jgi:hypothetical protein
MGVLFDFAVEVVFVLLYYQGAFLFDNYFPLFVFYFHYIHIKSSLQNETAITILVMLHNFWD